jgi:hypothetical protein
MGPASVRVPPCASAIARAIAAESRSAGGSPGGAREAFEDVLRELRQDSGTQ